MQDWKHFKTITKHKMHVMQGCFQGGLISQGITHDLSKYTPTEFRNGAKYYQGTRSPNAAEREDKGFSEAWMHHKGRNRHHYEYWQDVNLVSGVYEPVPMPRRYLVEMVMDRRAASMVYKGKNFPEGYFVPGRFAMTCCADDTQFIGFICKSQYADKLKNRQWVKVTAKIKVEFHKAYGKESLVLYSKKIESGKKPEEELVYFT